jgi:hypothetical protein
MGDIAAVAVSLGIDIAFIKGVSAESRWYSRMGERPTWDVDLVLAPWDLSRAAEFVAALQPTHSILPDLESILRRDQIQSIDLGYGGIPVDLHLDPLKLEVAKTRYPEQFWQTIEFVQIEGGRIPVFDSTVTLFLSALALNKDRFRYLIGYADLIRIRRDPGVDFSRCRKLARDEGLVVPYLSSLKAVEIDLGRSHDSTRPHPVWNAIWGPSIRLLGREAKVRFRYRQNLLPMFDLRRWPEVAASWWRRAFPTRALVERLYPDQKGRYLRQIIWGRVARRLIRRRQRRDARSSA